MSEIEALVVCSDCREPKPTSEFYRDAHRRSGLTHACKACCAVDLRRRKPWAKPAEKLKASARQVAYKAKNAAKVKARQAISDGLKRGKIVRLEACQRCGSKPEPQADGRSGLQFNHTHGYEPEHRLTGEWVCVRCHMKADRGVSRG